MPWRLICLMGAAGACLPALQSLRSPDPWMARVLLSERRVDQPYPNPGFDAALKALPKPAALGRAVDLLGLDKDAEFNGGKATALTVALELLQAKGAPGTDARSNAVSHLADLIRVEPLSAPGNAALLVKASEPAKAERIAEALAAVFTAPTDITGPVPSAAALASHTALEKAEADMAAFQSAPENAALADVLVDRSRIAGLADHIARLRQMDSPAGDLLAKATLADLLAGRIAGSLDDSGLAALLDAYRQASLSYDTLSGSLGPKHPQLLAAKSEMDDKRRALADGLSRHKSAAARQASERQRQLAALEKSKDELDAAVAASGIDLTRYDALADALERAREPGQEVAPAAPARPEPILEASAVEPLAAPRNLPLPLRMVLGGISGLGAALAFALAARSHRQTDAAAPEHLIEPDLPSPSVKAPAPVPETVDQTDLRSPRPAGPAPAAVNRQHAPANRVEADWLPGDALMVADEDLVLIHPAGHAAPADEPEAETWTDTGDLPTVVKLRRAAPQVFAAGDTDAEVERLRQELADLRSRVLRRSQGGV